MNVGAAQIEITPQPGIELAGFAIRPQPSTSVLDPLYIRALYLTDDPNQLLWVHCDLLALDQQLCDRFRHWCHKVLGIAESQVIASTTHTHSAPAAIQTNGCGRLNAPYVKWLELQLRSAALKATTRTERCRMVSVQGFCDRGVDRRGFGSGHVDTRVGALGWVREDGSFKAALLTYAMHPVCLRGSEISADWPGATSRALSQLLPGNPVCLVCSGASGNINPPAVGVSPDVMNGWGDEVAASVTAKLIETAQKPARQKSRLLQVTSSRLELPLDPWGKAEMDACVAARRADEAGRREFGEMFDVALEAWRCTMLKRFDSGEPPSAGAELSVVQFGSVTLLTVNAEVFSRFSALAANGSEQPVYTIGCANGMLGYMATEQAYEEGAYEVDWAMLFYSLPRLRRGGLEALARRAREFLPARNGHLQAK
jgi:hypothetical protein